MSKREIAGEGHFTRQLRRRDVITLSFGPFPGPGAYRTT